jgi:NifB/MoaA-like Fe-S oxidoreductase
MEQIKSKQQTVEETKKRIQVTSEPLEKELLEMDLKNLEDKMEELNNQLKNLPS